MFQKNSAGEQTSPAHQAKLSLSLAHGPAQPSARLLSLTSLAHPSVSLPRSVTRARSLSRGTRMTASPPTRPAPLPSFLPQIPSPSITAAIRRRESNPGHNGPVPYHVCSYKKAATPPFVSHTSRTTPRPQAAAISRRPARRRRRNSPIPARVSPPNHPRMFHITHHGPAHLLIPLFLAFLYQDLVRVRDTGEALADASSGEQSPERGQPRDHRIPTNGSATFPRTR